MILEKIAASTKKRVELAKISRSISQIEEDAFSAPIHPFFLEEAINTPEMSFICEVKKASPSKGLISADFPYLQIAREYENANASAISVLTEPDFFLGSNDYLTEISRQVSIPVLRKDFTVDPYQIYEARAIGASAVLLIAALLNLKTLKEYLSLCDHLGLSALVEAHDEREIQIALEAGARIIGVNNRNLKTFEVDFSNVVRLRNLVPPSVLFVGESGVRTSEDIHVLKNAGVNAVLVGETLMRSHNKAELLSTWREACND